jgi:hypothetical protein
VRKCRHPLSGSIYEYADDGIGPVQVTKGHTEGRFTANGVWVSGEVKTADPEMCRWIASGGPERDALATSRRFSDEALDASDPTELVPGGAA